MSNSMNADAFYLPNPTPKTLKLIEDLKQAESMILQLHQDQKGMIEDIKGLQQELDESKALMNKYRLQRFALSVQLATVGGL